ncbi:PAS domain-containing protein [Glaciecola sp. MH2013]|uniref:PAS domain-containing protein n=1 Tax=Glaciecola sp. MH2013 TaxID=2785524 RepID=UPI00189CE228|nr:PAS domain-containing protein [Glaciecola sp. MH2013]MBF7072298.1 PAS domain-containing protein [Glaciecola sp. MH2013]
MDVRFFKLHKLLSLAFLVCVLFPNTALAFTGFVKEGSPGTVAALIYALLFVITVLLIIPVVQFYFAALKGESVDKELKALNQYMLDKDTGAIYLDTKGKIVFANKLVKKLLNQERDVVGKKLDTFLELTYSPKLFTSDGKKPTIINTKVVKGDSHIVLSVGEKLIFGKENVRLVTMIIPSESADGSQGFEHLIKELDEVKGALNSSVQDMETVMHLSPVAIGKLNKKHQIISANKSLIKRLKYSEAELKKGNIYKLFSNSKQAELASNQLKEQKLLRDFHVKLVGKNGKEYPGEITIDTIDEEKGEYLFWIINRSDEQFQYEKFEALLQNNQSPAAIVTSEGMTKANRPACQFFNVASDDMLRGVFPYAEKFNDSDEKAEKLASMFQTARDNGGTASADWTFEINDRKRPCQIKLIPIFKDNQFDSVLFLWSDMTEIQFKTDSLAQSEVKLKEAVSTLEAKTKEVDKLHEQISSAATEKENIASQLSIAHSENKFLRENVEELTAEKENSSNGKAVLQEEIDKLAAKLKEAESREASLTKEHKVASQKLTDLEKQHSEASDALSASKTELTKQRDELEQRESELKKLTSEYEEQQQQFEKTSSELGLLKEDLQSKSEKLDEFEDTIFKLEREKEKTQSEISQLNEKVTEQKELIEKTKQSQQEVHKDSSEALKELQEQLAALSSSSEEKQQALIAEREKLQDELSGSQRALQKANQSLEEVQQLSKQSDSEREAQTSTIEKLKTQITELETESAAQRKELSAVNEKLESDISSEHGKAASLEASVQESNREIETLKQKIEEQMAIIAKFEKQSSQENAERQSSQTDLQNKLLEASDTMQSLQREIDKKESQQKQLASELEEQKKRASEYEASVAEAEKARKELESKLNQTEKQLEQAAATKAPASDGKASSSAVQLNRSDVESTPLPAKPGTWFDLSTYWATQSSSTTLTSALLELFGNIDELIEFGDQATNDGSAQKLIQLAHKLVILSKSINAEPLIDLAQSIEYDCSQGMDDNALLRWYPTRQGLERSRRVVYDHLQRL